MSSIYYTNKNQNKYHMIHDLENILQNKIYGQNHVIKKVVDKLKVSYAGLSDENKPKGSFLFTGPTGVGKTEFAIELAKNLKSNFKRFDMSEYTSKSDIKNLIGGSIGLIGYEEGGLLTNYIMDNPKCVLLLDEIEKAHPKILDIFLQVLDYGVLTSTKGEKAFFNEVIIIMTSNLGATAKSTVGFGSNKDSNKIDEVNKHLRPEFRARIDEMVEFNPLNSDMIDNIILKFIDNLNVKLKQKNIKLEVSNRVLEYLREITSKKNQGARGAYKIIEEEITLWLSHEILFGKLKNSGKVTVDINESNTFIYEVFEKEILYSKDELDGKIFYDIEEAQTYAKANPGVTITRSLCGQGFIIKDKSKDKICLF